MENYIINLTSGFIITLIVGKALKKIIFGYISGINSVKLDVEKRIEDIKSTHPLIAKEFDDEKTRKMVDYSNANTIFGLFSHRIGQGWMLPLFYLGVIPFCFHFILGHFPDIGIVGAIVAFSTVQILYSTVTGIPSDIFDTFRLEKYFGFSNMTKGLYVKDTIKGILVSVVISTVAILVLNWILVAVISIPGMTMDGGKILSCFSGIRIINPVIVLGLLLIGMVSSVVMSAVWMYWIAPLFNKFKPLEDGELKDKISKLVTGCGNKLSGIYIMDESKRTTKGNAYCATIPIINITKIVIFDNLLKNLTTDEIVAIFAHEMAHKKHMDGLKDFLFSLVGTVVSAFGITFFSLNPNLYHAFGFSWVNETNILSHILIGITLITTVIGSVSWILEPISSWFSRRMEYAADRGAVELTGDAENMATSLIKLYSKDLGDVLTHPLYEFFFYSHPSLVNRVKAINKLKKS